MTLPHVTMPHPPLPQAIAVDGPAGSGKSTICSALASTLGYLFVDTGAFYRAVTLAALRADIIQLGDQAVAALATTCAFDISHDRYDDEVYTIWLNGEDVTGAVRQPDVEGQVSIVAKMPTVRTVLNDKYREFAAARPFIIMAGRDIGTVVLPQADLKIYLDASPQVRAARRVTQRHAAGLPADYDAILANLLERDQIDSSRATAPLRQAEDAIYVNTDALDMEQTIAHIKHIVLAWQPLNRHSEG
jgi:cytidylate kinase